MPSIEALDEVPSLNLVCLPALMTMSGDLYAAHLSTVVQAVAKRRGFLLVDPPADATSAEAVLQHAERIATIVDANGALYWPALIGTDGARVAPSPYVARVIADVDKRRGVWKAPAGVEATIAGLRPGTTVDQAASETLNQQSVNVIRQLPRYGTVIWGARTLARNPEYRYVPVRRLLLFLEASIDEGLSWVVFEPNQPPLWMRVRAAVENFLLDLWRSGAFSGARPSEAFFVLCDQTTMTQDDIDNGRLGVTIGVAPARPAEFVIIRIARMTATS